MTLGKSSWNKGKKMSEKTKRKMSEIHKQIGTGKWMKGRKLSEETKTKIGESMRGENHWNWKDGRSKNKEYRGWLKNKRNRIKKQLNKDGSSHTFGEWELLKKQYGYICPSCKKPEPEIKLTEDHIIPFSKGGSDYIENIQPLCLHCNFVKHTKIIKFLLS